MLAMASPSSEVEIGQAPNGAMRYDCSMQLSFGGTRPRIDDTAWLAPSACVIGDVTVGAQSSIWYGAVVRGDIEPITIGARTNVQDNVTIHVTAGRYRAVIGSDVTIGHGAIVHGCTVADECLIGMGSIVLDGATIGRRCLIGAGSLLTPGQSIPPGMLVLGRPGKVIRPLTTEEIDEIASAASRYVDLAVRHRADALPAEPARPGGSEGER